MVIHFMKYLKVVIKKVLKRDKKDTYSSLRQQQENSRNVLNPPDQFDNNIQH